MAGGDPQSAVAGCRLDPSNKQTTFQKSGYQWKHTTRSGRRKGPPHSQSFPASAFRRRVMSQSALRDHPSGSSFDTDLDSRMGMKRIQPSDDFDQRVQSGRSTAAQEQVPGIYIVLSACFSRSAFNAPPQAMTWSSMT